MNNDQITSLFWFGFGLYICVVSINYKLGTPLDPGAGFTPFLIGLAMCLFSLIGFVQATARKNKGEGWMPIMKGFMWKKSVIGVGALLAYALLLDKIGFSACSILLIAFLLRAIYPQKWSIVILGSIGITASAYAFFVLILETQLPKGPWGF